MASRRHGSISGSAPQFSLCPPNRVMPRKTCFKHTIKTRILLPRNAFCPSNLKAGYAPCLTQDLVLSWMHLLSIPGVSRPTLSHCFGYSKLKQSNTCSNVSLLLREKLCVCVSKKGTCCLKTKGFVVCKNHFGDTCPVVIVLHYKYIKRLITNTILRKRAHLTQILFI